MAWKPLVLPLALLGLGCCSAAPLVVLNPGFEDTTVGTPFNEFTFGAPSGWQLYDPSGVTSGGDGPTYYVGTLTPVMLGGSGAYEFFPQGASEGDRVGIAFNFAGSGDSGEYGLQQTLTDSLQANTSYTLQVEIGNIGSGTGVSGQYFPLDGFPGYRVQLLAGDVVVAMDNNTLAGDLPDGQFGTSVVTLAVGESHPQLGEALGIRLVNLNTVDPLFPGSDLEVDFDNVRLDALPLLPADYNHDARVDAADYAVWRNGDSPDSSMAGYLLWREHYGAASGDLSTHAAPSPRAGALVSWLALALVRRLPRPAARR